MFIAKHRNTFLIISGLMALVALAVTFTLGLNQGIDFTGGTSIEVVGDVEKESVESFVLEEITESSVSVQEFGDEGYIIRTPYLEEDERSALVSGLEGDLGVSVNQFSSVGPTIGAEMQQKSIIAVIIVTVSIVLFIAFAFRQVSKPISSWAYGGATIISQGFDVVFTIGVFAVFGVLFGAEVDSLFIIALLTVIGYSVNDTIVVFDRIRENLKNNEEKKSKEDFDTTVGKSVQGVIVRSINTSLTTSLALVALYIFGGEPTKIFSLTLLVGVLVGAYSSIFFASPLLLLFNQMRETREKKEKKNK